MESISAIAASIRTARKDAGLTQRDLADLAETSERTSVPSRPALATHRFTPWLLPPTSWACG